MAAHESPHTTKLYDRTKDGLPRTKWRELGFRWWVACNRAPLGGNIDLALPDGLSRYYRLWFLARVDSGPLLRWQQLAVLCSSRAAGQVDAVDLSIVRAVMN